MPLIEKAVPLEADRQSTAFQVPSHDSVKQRQVGYEEYRELDDDFVPSDMEGSLRTRPRLRKVSQAPALPLRSAKRASRILDDVILDLDGSLPTKEVEQRIAAPDPHELYLSSEEDASFSDGYSDSESLLDFSPSGGSEINTSPSSRVSSRKSQEDTARVVSLTIVGKPQIVEILLNKPAPKRDSMALDANAEPNDLPPARKPSPLRLYPSAFRRLSISSTMSFSNTSYIPSGTPNESTPNLTALPPRKSSKMASNFSSIVSSTKHAFLSSDPYPANEAREIVMPDDGTQNASHIPPTPKTPISMAAAAWKTGISRTLSKARKQSMPKISLAYTAGVVTPRDDPRKGLGISVDTGKEVCGVDEMDPWKQRQRAATTPLTHYDAPVRYEDIMRNAVKGPPPAAVRTKDRSMSLGMRGLARRKSVKGKDRYLG